MPSKKDEKTEDRCPNCGYCPHCGQSTKAPQIVKEVIREPRIPFRPAIGPYYGERPYWWGSGNISVGRPEGQYISINSTEAVSRERFS